METSEKMVWFIIFQKLSFSHRFIEKLYRLKPQGLLEKGGIKHWFKLLKNWSGTTGL